MFHLLRQLSILSLVILCLSAHAKAQVREVEDFNFQWFFTLEQQQAAHQQHYDHSQWQQVNLPHDWAVNLPYSNDGGAASTGFKAGGIGWYRKSFSLSQSDQDKHIWLEFDGIYNHSDIWINGHHVGGRPYGYSSFNVDLTDYLYFDGSANNIAVKVNRTSYGDSRWYTGSGIYRNVRLVKANVVHVPQWGVQITTPEVSTKSASLHIKTQVHASKHQGDHAKLSITIIDPQGNKVKQQSQNISLQHKMIQTSNITITTPKLWDLTSPNLYKAIVEITFNEHVVDKTVTTFGIRDIEFDANKGFFLNGQSVKFKGVNLHHDAGAVGTAVNKSVWRSRLNKLKSIGVNALRLSHNPHSPELLDLADELGFLVNAEAFDDWDRAKGKSLVTLGDNKVTGRAGHSYNEYFNQWAERDLKDLIKRDYNHPSIIMWSIGNEIEWTYTYYQESGVYDVEKPKYYHDIPQYDKATIQQNLKKNNPNKEDNLPIIANQLAKFVKQVDTSRPVTAGLVMPSVGFASGYTDALDLVGFNYRAQEYAPAHHKFPNAVIYGSENWGTLSEWNNVKDKDYIAGIFIWTGFAYKGESGPLPKMGLEISLFDFIGNKTPRGHFFETLWVDKPKIWLGATALQDSEFSYSEKDGWQFTARSYPDGVWPEIRLWEWYNVSRNWQYQPEQPIVIQSYTNTEQAELFLNGKSLGKKSLVDFNDNVIKWLVPFQSGELKVVGYNQGKKVVEDTLATHGEPASLVLIPERDAISANGYDSVYLHATLLDANGNLIPNNDAKIAFTVDGPVSQHFVDNGSEYNVDNVKANSVKNHKGRAAILVQSSLTSGKITITAHANGIKSNQVTIKSKNRYGISR